MNAPNDTIRIEFDLQTPVAGMDMDRLKCLVRDICIRFEVHHADVGIRVVDDAGIIDVHRQYLGQADTTDVISFDLSDEFEARRTVQLVVNVQMAARQAILRGHSVEAELALYVTHGLLHNLGFDDADPAQARTMHDAEDSILHQNGFGVIYHSDKR